jgi:arginine utilization regulatory protein
LLSVTAKIWSEKLISLRIEEAEKMFIESFDTKQMLEAILSSIDEAIHAVNSDGITIFYNKVASRHDGVEIDEVLGKHILELFPSLNKETSTLLKVIETGKPIFQQPQTYKNIRGQLIDTVNTTLPIKVMDKVVGAVEIAKDLSTVKQLSQKLIDLQAKVDKKNTKPVKDYGARFQLDDIITVSPKMTHLKELGLLAAKSESPVLIYGETGTGKELLIQSIHNASHRKNYPFIAQNCAALPASLLESILFGTKKGSFTGAIDRPGLFELAHRGTLFLDEVNSMPLDVQAKLLRVLEDGVIRRVGGTDSFQIDVRVVAAMNDHPFKALEQKTIRQDLFYRLNVFFLEIPPLRERVGDIPVLIHHFIQKYNLKLRKQVKGIDSDALTHLKKLQWLGNVRELEHTIEYAMNLVKEDTIDMEHLPVHLQTANQQQGNQAQVKPLRTTIEQTEMALIQQALLQVDGSVQAAAGLLQIPRQTLQYKIKKYGLS